MTAPGTSNADHLFLLEPGLWVQILSERSRFKGRPALFLDRDGTINVDTGYPRDPTHLELIKSIVPVIHAANRAGWAVVVVSNQSGIARGLLDWKTFAAVNTALLAMLRDAECRIDMVLACAYHEAGGGSLRVGDHAMRKPNPGMILLAGDTLKLDLAGSLIVGDKMSDMEAGRRAGLAAGWLANPQMASNSDSNPFFSMLIAPDDYRKLIGQISGSSSSE